MKRIIIILALVLTSMVCNAQIRYLGTTNNRQTNRLSSTGSIKSRRCKHIQRPPITSQATDT